MINSTSANNQNTNANMISAQNSVSSVSSSPLPGSCQNKVDDELKNAVHSRSQSVSQSTESPQHQGKSSSMSSTQSGQSAEVQLKYENDRLKLALAQSSANAKKWEVRSRGMSYFYNCI
ncbi:hypothetical protein PUN28_014837 [Cardiocondyla obscurior]|uniref:Uncharacterized protein n=1 Tax=Cardiocondyla obscurior TaxID=286306 RepID=A0AAW2EVP6_9HYME